MEKSLFLKGFRPFLWIFFIGLLVYGQSLFFNFTYLDDQQLILENYHFIRKLSNIFSAFTTDVFQTPNSPESYYRPLLTVSFIFDAQLGQNRPFFYHLTNINLHLLTACLLFVFFKKLLFSKFQSFLTSLFFLLHPAISQAVVWIPGRNDSLLTVFALASFIFFLDYLNTKKLLYLLLHFGFFISALLTKETALFIPLLALLYLWLVSTKKINSLLKKNLVFGWLIVFISWISIRFLALNNPLQLSLLEIGKMLINNGPALLLYLGKIVFPFNLSVLPILPDSTLAYGLLALGLVILTLALSTKKQLAKIIFGTVWFLLFLIPAFIRPNTSLVADFLEHRLYLPIIGFFIVVKEIDFIKQINFNSKKVVFYLFLILSCLAIIAFGHSRNFKNRLAFWQNAVKTSPHHPLTHRNLGAMLYLDGRLDQAEEEYLQALKLNSQEQMVHNNLGLIYLDKGLYQQAEEEFKKELSLNPYYDRTHFNLGLLYYQQDKKEQAVDWWQKTIKLNNSYFPAYLKLAVYYQQKQEFKKAAFFVREVLKKGGQVPSPLLQTLRPYL